MKTLLKPNVLSHLTKQPHILTQYRISATRAITSDDRLNKMIRQIETRTFGRDLNRQWRPS